MVKYSSGDIFQAKTGAIVIPVNCVGVMGAGLAKKSVGVFPLNCREYVERCRDGLMKTGTVFTTREHLDGEVVYVVNFPTKNHWRNKSEIEYVRSGLESLVRSVKVNNIRSIAIPALGCGLGGLDFADVVILIDKHMGALEDVETIVFRPR